MRRLTIVEEEYKKSEKDESVSYDPSHKVSTPVVGIWWYLNNKVYGFFEAIEDCPAGRLVCTDKEHSRTFHVIQDLLKEEVPDILKARFNEVE